MSKLLGTRICDIVHEHTNGKINTFRVSAYRHYHLTCTPNIAPIREKSAHITSDNHTGDDMYCDSCGHLISWRA